MNIYYEKDADLSLIQSKKVAVIGYGSQGHAHVLNARDSGVKEIAVGLQENSSSRAKCAAENLDVMTPAEATKWADVVMILIPDEKQSVLWANEIEPHVRAGQHIMFGHGFNVHYNLIRPRADVDVSLSAPKGPGHTLARSVPARVSACRDWLRSIRMRAAQQKTLPCLTQKPSATRAQA